MSEQSIKLGDIVVLKSGSPKMTVINMHNNKADCMRYEDGKIHISAIPAVALEAWKNLDSYK